MNQFETMKIMAVIETAYPRFYAQKTAEDRENAVKLWTQVFAEDPYNVVSMAVMALIKTSPYPPQPSDVNAKIQQITQPEQMTELEAWSLVHKALRNSTYNSGEEFRKLPEVIQRLVGEPMQLKNWAGLDDDALTVVASNFQRSYKVRAKNERDYLALPANVKKFMANLSEGMKMPALTEGEITEDKRMDAIRRLSEL